MKPSLVLCLQFILLGICHGHHSPEHDSEIAEKREDNYRTSRQWNAMEDSQPEMFLSEEESRFILRRYMRPVRIGPTIYWVELGREYIDRRPSQSPFLNLRTSKPYLRRTTQTNINNKPAVHDFKSPMPPNRFTGNSNNNRGILKIINSAPSTTEDYIDENTPETDESSEDYIDENNPVTEVSKSPGRIPPDSNFFAGIVNDFAFKLVDTLNLESNFVISPLSIFIALSMGYLGAGGKTKAQMEQVLGMDNNAIHEEHLHQGISDLLFLVLQYSCDYELFFANGMFSGQKFTVDDRFQENVKEYYDAELKNLDFRKSQLSQQFINDWVSRNTKSKITSMIDSPPSLSTHIMLLNAVYFKGVWELPFSPLDGKFHTLDGVEKQARFMQLHDVMFPAFQSDEHKHSFIKLPYYDDQLSMIIALPYSKEQEPMPSMTNEILCHIRDAMEDTEFNSVVIPKFCLEYTTSLTEPLQKLGMKDIFDANAANLRKLRKEKDVHVSDIIHKAVVQVSETGTPESAVRPLEISSAARKPMFVADHPFAFYIVHEASGLVLFNGKVFDVDYEKSNS